MLCGTSQTRIPLDNSPSTCALDASIIPLPSIFLLIFLICYIPFKLWSSRASPSPTNNDPYSQTFKPLSVFPKWVHYLYVGLVVCLLAMRILEVARLIAASMGVGLLPLGLIANVVVIVMLCLPGLGLSMGTARGIEVSIALLSYWALSTVLEAIKVVRLATYNQLHPAKGTAYPSSDWLLDNAVMLALLAIFLVLESIYVIISWRSSKSYDSYGGVRRSSTPKLRDLEIGKPKVASGSFIQGA